MAEVNTTHHTQHTTHHTPHTTHHIQRTTHNTPHTTHPPAENLMFGESEGGKGYNSEGHDTEWMGTGETFWLETLRHFF